jgi:hypothetical protein
VPYVSAEKTNAFPSAEMDPLCSDDLFWKYGMVIFSGLDQPPPTFFEIEIPCVGATVPAGP